MGKYIKQGCENLPVKLLGLLCALAMGLAAIGLVVVDQARADSVRISCMPSHKLPDNASAEIGTYCWIDFRGLDVNQALQPDGQPMTLDLPGGSTLAFNVHIDGDVENPTYLGPANMDKKGFGAGYFTDLAGQPLINMQSPAAAKGKLLYRVSLKHIVASDDIDGDFSIAMVGRGFQGSPRQYINLQYRSTRPIDKLYDIPGDPGTFSPCPDTTWGNDVAVCSNQRSGEISSSTPMAVTVSPSQVSMALMQDSDGAPTATDFDMAFAVSARSLNVSNSVSVPKGARAGTKETYTITASDRGTDTFKEVELLPQLFEGLINKPDFKQAECSVTDSAGTASKAVNGHITLSPGVSVSCSADATVTQQDVDAGAEGHFLGLARGKGSGQWTSQYSSLAESTVEVDPDPHAAVQIDQYAKLENDSASHHLAAVSYGDQVRFVATATNEGLSKVTDVNLVEESFSGKGTSPKPDFKNVRCNVYHADHTQNSYANGKIVLEPRDRVECQAVAPYTVDQVDTVNGQLSNTFSAYGTDSLGKRVDARTADNQVLSGLSLKVNPHLLALKVTLRSDHDGGLPVPVGDRVQYTADIENSGGVSLTAVSLAKEAFSGSGKVPVFTDCQVGGVSVKNGEVKLGPGQKATCATAPDGYTVTAEDGQQGKLSYTVKATGQDGFGQSVGSDGVTDELNVARPPSSLLVELTSDRDSQGVVTMGDTVTYSLKDTNKGQSTLHKVKLSGGEFTGHGPAPTFEGVKCAVKTEGGRTSTVTNGDITLSPGDTVSCQAASPYVVSQPDATDKKLVYHASSAGEDLDGNPVNAKDKNGSLTATDSLAVREKKPVAQPIFRLYNLNSGEHFYTASGGERDVLIAADWSFEGTLESAPSTGKPVYRVYNPNAKGGDHYYTLDKAEATGLVAKGWRWDNNAQPVFYSGGTVPVYVAYNPNAVSGSHNFTTSAGEQENLMHSGWKYGKIAWYAQEAGHDVPKAGV